MDTTQGTAVPRPGRSRFGTIVGILLGLIGLWLAVGGIWLVWLGGSPYYVFAGTGCLVAAWFYLSGHPQAGLRTYLAVFAGTCLWAVAEVGTAFWPLVPRIVGPAVFAVIVLLEWLFRRPGGRSLAWSASVLAVAALALFVGGLARLPETAAAPPALALPPIPGDEWTAFGRDTGGQRFSPASQITADNVAALTKVWEFRTGDWPSAYPGQTQLHTFEATPLKIGDLLYICTPRNIVIALDADTGRQRWRYDPKINLAGTAMLACRGVSHFDAGPGATTCRSRIITGTMDARLIALDALTGELCPDFGTNGTVTLKDGLGVAPEGRYSVTSPPTIVNGIAVVGGFVFDGLQVGEPSGVIRGYDASTGRLAWSWDAGAVDENRMPRPGEHYTRGSPNSWTVMSADPMLGLVYVPMGNATPDYVGMHRTPEHGRYSSAVVALDARTGQRRWHFQTVRHDLWDYDIGSQPVLFDMPMPDGSSVPALAQPTKQGDIYILDRRTGAPLAAVTERKVPGGSIPAETYAPTQPFSTGFPSPLERKTLDESDMWGATALDQLWCRIAFRSRDYAGMYTPPSVRGTIQFPSNFGVMNWGSVAIDPVAGRMFVNSSHVPTTMRLIPRAEMAKLSGAENKMFSPQLGTPYAANPQVMLSPLGIPCNAPPWGKLTAIDLSSRTIVWQRPLGTSRDHAPFGIAVPGAPNVAGATATAGGLVFIGATIDNYLRAFDFRNGRELWRARLPAGGQAAPMTYVSGRTGRQYVVIAAGGHQLMRTKLGDYVVAYALPDPPGGTTPANRSR